MLDHVWVLEYDDLGFSAELWNVTDGTLVRTIRVEPDWWISPLKTAQELERDASSGILRDPPSSMATDLMERDGVVWVSVYQADDEWQKADMSEYDPAALFDVIVIAIDPSTGAPIRSHRFRDHFVVAYSNEGRLATYSLEEMGHPRLRLHDIRLEGYHPGG